MGLGNSIRRLFAARKTAPNPELSAERVVWLPRASLGDIRMTPDEALRLSAVWACVTVTSKALASCPWDVFRELDNGDREPRRRLTTYSLLNIRPNPETTAFAFKEAMYIQAMVWGNFFAEIEMDRGGRPVGLWPLAPDRCCLEREDDGRMVVVVRNQGGAESVLDYQDVFHIHGPGIDGLSGFDVVALAARGLAHAAAAERFGQSFYHNNAHPGGLLSTDNNLSNESRESTRKAVEDRTKGSDKAFNLLLLDSGFKYTPLGTEPNKAQFIETRYLLIEEVCRWFGVPPHKIAHLLRATFGNIEHQSIEFVRDALVPWAERGRQEADWKLLRPFPGIRTRLDLDWLQEGDAKSKADTDSVLVQNGLITRNEARKRRGLNTIGPDGDKLTVQVNMTTLDKVGMEEVVPADQETAAAVALFRMAMLRSMQRRTRIASDLSATCDTPDDFRAGMDADAPEHARYVGHAVAQAIGTLGIDLDSAELSARLGRHLDDEQQLLLAAFEGGHLNAWCNQPLRAGTIAADLAALIKR